MVEIVPCTPDRLAHIAANLRPGDREEVWASGYDDPLQAIQQSVAFSTHSAVFLSDGEPFLVGGVSPLSLTSGTGSPWLLATPVLRRERRALQRLVPPYIAAMRAAYPTLINYVHAKNLPAVAWLQRIGFVMEPAAPHGPRGEPFHRFSMES